MNTDWMAIVSRNVSDDDARADILSLLECDAVEAAGGAPEQAALLLVDAAMTVVLSRLAPDSARAAGTALGAYLIEHVRSITADRGAA